MMSYSFSDCVSAPMWCCELVKVIAGKTKDANFDELCELVSAQRGAYK